MNNILGSVIKEIRKNKKNYTIWIGKINRL